MFIYVHPGKLASGYLLVWGPVLWDLNRVPLSNNPFHQKNPIRIQTTNLPFTVAEMEGFHKKTNLNWLVVEPTHLKNIRQIGNLPQFSG